MKKEDITLTLDNMIATDKDLTSDEIMEYIIDLVKKAEKIKDFTSRAKHNFVLRELKKVVGIETYHRYEAMFESSINLICKLGKDPKILKGINDGLTFCIPIFKKCC